MLKGNVTVVTAPQHNRCDHRAQLPVWWPELHAVRLTQHLNQVITLSTCLTAAHLREVQRQPSSCWGSWQAPYVHGP